MTNGAIPGFPGANIFQVVMAAPMDLFNLTTRHAVENLSLFNLELQRIAAASAGSPGTQPQPITASASTTSTTSQQEHAAAAQSCGVGGASSKDFTARGGSQPANLYRVTIQS